MDTIKVFVNDDDEARLLCPRCGARRTVNVKKFKNREEPLKVKCTCQSAFRVFLDSRRTERKETYLQGYYRKLPEDQEWGKILVRNVSRVGIGFVTLTTHSVKSGDQIRITLTWDDMDHADIDKDATVKFVSDKYLGCEFSEPLQSDEALPLHLLA
jgi:hypothetical protein